MLGHKGEVNSIAVHPIGNVALSVGRWALGPHVTFWEPG